MKEQSTETVTESRPVWEGLEAFARQGVQELLHRMLEEEVAAMLGRRRYARRESIDATTGYRNGYGQPRRLSLSVGTITLRRPRVRGLTERFEPARRGRRRRDVCQRSASETESAHSRREGRRLSSFTHFLTRPPPLEAV